MQQCRQCREDRSIRPGQSQPAHLAAQHGDLVAKHEDFGVF
jgi:hypothetical protein